MHQGASCSSPRASRNDADEVSWHATHTGPCQKFARNYATRNLAPPYIATLGCASHQGRCVVTLGAAWRREPPEHQW
jgi:hypothetical protein